MRRAVPCHASFQRRVRGKRRTFVVKQSDARRAAARHKRRARADAPKRIQRLRNWVNGGRFDGASLDPSAQQLRKTYQLLLNAVRTEAVITKGQFYDLMYANANNPRFDSNHQYAFLRKYQHEVLLVVANFDRAEQRVWVNIPVDAFKTLGFADNRPAMVTDLLSGEQAISTLTDAYPYFVQLPAYSGRLLKFTFR